MKIGRRSKHISAKSFFSGPFLRRLNRREKLELAEKSAAAKPVVKARRPAFGLETVEPRLLMSADLSYTTLNDTLTLSIGGTSAAPIVKLSDGSGQLAQVALTNATGAAVNIGRSGAGGGGVSADTLHVDLTNFALLNSFVSGNGGQLTVKFDGGDEFQGTPHPFTDVLNVDGNGGTLSYGLTVQSTSDINSSASVTATNLTLTSAQTASDLLSTGLFANANTGIDLTGAHLTTTAGALTLNATSTLSINTDGTGMSAVKGAVITSFSSADIDIGGNSVLQATGGDLGITASVNGSLTATASGATVKLIVIAGSAAPEVTIGGGSSLTSTTGAVNAAATTNVTISATATPDASANTAKVDAAVLSTTYADSATMTVNGGANISAHTSNTLSASSTLTSSTIGNAHVANTAGAAVAVSVITGDTTASVTGATVSGSSVSLTAASNRTLTTTANSSPGGAASSGNGSDTSEQTLANNNASTGSSGSVTLAGAIAVSTDTGLTSAFLGTGAMVNAGAGAATVSASSVDVVAVTGDGEFTQAGTTGVGVGVAIGVADRTDTACITGTVHVTAGSLDVAVLEPSASSFTATATSGVGDSTKVGVAGSLAINVTILDHEAYLDTNAVLNLAGGTNATFESHDVITNTDKALPSDTDGTSTGVSIGASFAINYGQDLNEAYIGNGATLANANNLTLTAIGVHTMQTDATNGGQGATAITPIVATSVADDDSSTTLGTGTLLTIGGALSAASTLTNTVSTNAVGDTKSSKTGVGIALALNIVNDHSTSTTGRDITSGGAMSFLSTTVSGSEAFASASVVGGQQDDGNNDQSTDSQTASQKGTADSTASAQDSKATGKASKAKGTEGAKTPSQSTADGQISVAGAVAVNVNQSSSQAYIADGRNITAGGVLTVKSAANVDGAGSATGAAVANAITIDPTKVSTAASTITLASSTLKTGDGVTYYAGVSGGGIGGLTSGTKYFVNVASGGVITLYDTAAHANAGGATGKITLTSAGSTGQFFDGGGKTGTSVGAAVGVNYVTNTNLAYLGGSTFHVGGLDVEATQANQTFAFNPASAVNTTTNTINLGVTSLATGDGITYTTTGTTIGGLTAGTEYYVNVQADGSVKLYDSQENAVAAGTDGLITLTAAGSGTGTMTNASDNYSATAISGAGGGKTGVAGSAAINITETDAEADLGYTQPSASPGVPVITITGAGNVTLNATDTTVVGASATPVDGGASGDNLGVGISAALNYAQASTLAQVANGVVLTGANNLTLTATASQDMSTTTKGGASGSTGVTPVIDIAITDNDVDATLGTGAAISLTGAFSATASLNDQVESSATGSTKSSGTGVGITVTVTVVNDNALATTGRNLTTTDATPANGTITFSATDLSSSQSNATASVAGGDDDDGSGSHSDNGTDQSVDNTTKKQSSFGDLEVKGTDSKAKGTKGADTNDKAKSSSGSVSVAGAVAVNVENGTAEAFIPDGLTVIATGMLSVTTAAQVNGQAIANGSAAATDGGTGVGVAVAVNVANQTNTAYIGNNTVINSGGLTVTAGIAPRSVKLATKALPVVNLSTAAGEKANTIFLGLGTGLSQGDLLRYNSNGGTAIGGLTNGTTYFVAGQGDGTFKLYDTAAHAKAGGDTGLIKFTSAGTGTQQFTQQLFGIIPTGTISFAAGGTVTVLDLGDESDLHTGDVVTYNNGGGSNMGGLTNGTQYYIIDLTDNQALLATSLDNAQVGTAITFGAAGSSKTQVLTDNTDNNRAEATSGGSGGDIGISVSVGVNVVKDITSASVGDTAALAAPKVTISHPGAVTVTATSAATNIARALPSSGGTGGSSVGVGASVGVNTVTDKTTATIIDGTTWAGTAGAVTVSATAIDTAITHGENGASGGGVSIGIGAAVAVINDTTTAYVGTGAAINASGNVAITASETGTFEDTTNAKAAGSSVAVGASVSVSVVNETVGAQVARSIATTAGTLAITSTATIVNETEATASAMGEDSNDSQSSSNGKSGADGQADKQLNGNSNTSGSGASLPSASGETSSASSTSSSQGGGDSGNVGVAASVAVGVLSVNNTATVTNSAALTATGAITVQAQAGITDTTQAVGSAISLQSGSTDVGAGVAVGIVNTTNMATVASGSVLTGNGITIAAITPAGVVDTFIVWGAAAAGGTGDAAIAGSVAINVINTDDTEAWAASGSTLHSTGALTVKAINNVNIQTLAAAGALSDGTSIGAAVDVAILNVTSNAFIAGNANATGALTIDAEIVLAPTKLAIPKAPSSLQPTATSVAVAGAAGTGSAAIAGSVIVDVFTMNAAAYIGPNSVVSAGSASITALNTSTITGIAGALGATTGAVGIGASLDLEVINKQTFAYLAAGANLTLSGVGAATIAATSKETMLSVAATAGIGDDAGIAATASIAVINTDTEAYLGNNAVLTGGGAVGVTASSAFFTTMIAGSVGVGSTAGVGAANSTLVHSATTKADTGTKATVTAAGAGLTISATESEDILAIVAGVAVGGTAGVAGSATVNVLTEVTTADVGAGSTITVNGAGNLIVSASDSTSVISVAGDLAAGGDAGIGVGVDVGTYSKKTNAFIDSGVTATVGGNIEVLAQASENLVSVAAGIAVGTVAVGVNAGVHVFTLQTRAFIGNDPNAPTNQGAGNVHAAGSVVIAANDASDLSEVVGVLAAGAVGVAAGAGVNVFTKDTESFIGTGANVTGLGGGAGLTVNTGRIDTGISASTSTFSADSPSGQGIQSESASTLTNAANGNHAAFASAGQVGTPSVGGMDLTGNGNNNQQVNNSSLTGLRTTSVDTQAGFHGVAVAATNQDEIRTFTVTFGAGEVGIAVSAGVDVVKANTQAYVGNNAQVNTGTGVASAAQSVLVGAGDDFYHLSVGVGVGVGAVGVAPTVGVNVITDTTGASINTGAKVNAAGSVAVEATGSENIVMIGVGAAAGAVGVGAVVDVLSVTNTTLASIGNSATVHAGGNVFVSAEDDTSVLELSGALAGGFVGVGGSVGVMLITKTTDATIGTGANVEGLGNGGAVGGALNGNISGSTFGTTNANGVIVQAQSSETVVHIVAAGAVGYVGVSGAVGLSFLNVTTDATIGANAVINNANPGQANGNQSVYVNAADNVGFQAYVIGVAGGFVGVTGAVDVGTLSDNIAAVVQAGAVVNAKNNVEVNAVGIQNLTGYVISGAGGAVAAGASVMDWSIGQTLQTSYSDNSGNSASGLTNGKGDPDSNAASQSQSGTGLVTGSKGIGSLNSGGAQANSNAGHINSATSQAGGMANAAAPTSTSILLMQGSAPVNPGTTADIQGGAKITAGQNIGVIANESATVKEFLGQVAVGVVGAGAAVDILKVANNVTANDDGTNTAGNTINVHAILNSNVNIVALDLAAGFVGLGAGVVVVNDNSSVLSTLGSVTKAKAVTLQSDSTRTLTTLTGQASVGAVGAGATFTEITVAGVTLATVDAGAVIGSVATPIGSLTVTVHSTVTVTESTDAVAAGIGAATANFSFLTVDPTVSAAIGGSAVIDAVNAVTLDATSTVDAQGKTFGVAAGGLAVGVSLTEVTVSPAVTADVGNSDQITAGSLSITAATFLPASGYDAQATATGSAGALIGVTSTNTKTTNNDSVNAFIGNAAKVAVVGAVLVTALNNTGQKSSADSNAGGLIAAGLASSSANSNTTTKAYLGTSVVMTAGDLTIAATGVDNNFADTNAGSGGLIAGSSSVANTTSNSTTLAQVGASDNIHLSDTNVGPVNGLIVAADHTAQFNDQITTFAGGLFAGAGGSVTNNVTSNDQAVVGANAMIAAYNIDVTAVNTGSKPSLGAGTPNVYGTTGGLVSGAGASVSTTISFTTAVTVGSGAFMNALGVQSNVPTFQLEAGNVFNVNDDLTFETGGAFSGAGANASISVPTDIAKVEVQSGAILQSQGAIVINARGHGSFDEEVQTDTFGLGTVSVGTASAGTNNAPINAVNQVLIDAGSILTAYGDLDIAAGTDGYPDYDQYAVTARYDSYAGALVPISDVNSNAYLKQTNTITISGAAVLKTAQQVNLAAQALATGNMISFATGVSWASDVADAILTALGGGGVEVHGGNANNQTYSTITNNGTVQTGINSHLTLTLVNNPNFNPADPNSQAVIATAGSSPTITFQVGTAIPTNPLVAELAFDQEQLALYGPDNTSLRQYYTAEIQRITAVLTSEGLLTNEPGGQQSANPQPELEVTINPIYAEAGLVNVHATEFGGTGTIIAPNSASVTIINNSAASLNLLGIDIPDTNGGLWYDIGLVTTNAQINTINNNNRNADKNSPPDAVATPAFNLSNVAGGPAAVVPAIIVENTFNINQYNAQHPDAPLPWPSIDVLPTSAGGIGITNPGGSMLLKNDKPSTGNITVEGPVNVGTQDIETGGTLVITGVSDEEVGGDPYKAWDAITVGPYVGGGGATTGGVGPATASAINSLLTTPPTHGLTGASITVNADYIDVNGLINAGVSTYNLTINSGVSAEIQSLLNQGYTGLLNLAAESTANFVVDYNTQTHQIVVTSLPVNGGFVSLTGHIVNTGDGTINVFGGYGSINVTNNTNFDLGLQTLDTSQPGQGTLIINDLAKNGQSASTFSTYQFVPGTGIQVKTDGGGSSIPIFNVVAGSSTTYSPAAGWRYGWTIQDSEQTILQQRSVSSNWIGLIPTGSSFAASASVVANGTPKISPSGPYFYIDNSLTPGSAAYNLHQKVVPITTSTGAIITKFHTEISHWYGGHTYSALFQQINGTENLYENDISASRNIAVNFTGGATGGLTVTNNGNGNVHILGNVLDPHGATTINAVHGSIIDDTTSALVTGQSLTLKAAGPIGSVTAPIQVVVTGTAVGLNASTISGDVNITALTGDLTITSVVSGSQGAVNLTSTAGIPTATSGPGLVQGGIITLVAKGGGIGTSTALPILLSTPNPVPGLVDTITATAQTNVYLQEKTGNMLVNSITTGGDVWVNAPNGSILNANSNSTIDTRTQAQLAAGVWTELGLTSSTGYQSKVNNTLASFVGEQNAQYEAYWQDLMAGNTAAPGFSALAAIFGAGGSYAQQNPSYNPNVYYGDAAVISAPAYFTGNTSSAPAYFTAAGTVQTASVYFTAGSGGTNGTITRTDGGSWVTQGFAVGQAITVGGSNHDSTGTASFTITAVTANVITLSPADVIQTEASASNGEAVTVQANATINRTTGSWLTDGFAVGQTISVSGSAANSTAAGVTYTITAVSAGAIALSPTSTIATEASAGTPETITVTNNKSGTITRTDGGSWIASGFAVGQTITVGGSAGNGTSAGETYTIAAITASTITLAASNQIVNEASSALPETVSLQHNTSDGQIAISGFFTAKAGSTPGSITRTDGGNWLTDGFAVGQTVLVNGSAGNSTVGATSYTVTAVSATVLTLSNGDTIVTEGTAAVPEAFTVQHKFSYQLTASQSSTLTGGIKDWTPAQLLSLFGAGLLKDVTDTVVVVGAPDIIGANVTMLTGGGVGTQNGGTITIPLSYPPNAPTVLTTADQIALAGAERVDVQYLAGPAFNATVNFGTNTITRTDGGNWSALAVGESLSIQAVSGKFTQNATDGTIYYKIIAINGTTLTIDSTTPLVAVEVGKTVSIAPVILDPSFQASAAAKSVSVYFTANTASSGGTITRTSGSWLTDGFAVGQLVEIGGSLKNSTSPDVPDVIVAVTATTITLASNTLILAEASAATPETISIIRGIAPKPTAIQIQQITPINVNATGLISITAKNNVYLDSAIDVRLNQVAAGTLSIGSQIQIKGQQSILNGTGSSIPNLQGGNIILEAAGLNGSAGTIGTSTVPVTIASVGTGTVTARAKGDVAMKDVASAGNAGNLQLETVFSQTGNAILSAAGSITAALDNGFTTIQANNVVLIATGGTIGNIVGGSINYIYLNNPGTVEAIATGNVWVSEGDLFLSFKQSLNTLLIGSTTGNVTLRAGLSILDGTNNPTGTEVIGNNITLMALSGGIGLANDPLGIHSAFSAAGNLTASANLANIYIVQTAGTVSLATVTDPGRSVFITALQGSILNGSVAGVTNITAANADLIAQDDIGAPGDRITTQVSVLETLSITGDTEVDNMGALSIGGSFTANAAGAQAGGDMFITASSPVTIVKSLYAVGDMDIIAMNGPVGSTTDGPGNLVVNAVDLKNNALLVEAGDSIALLAGDNLTIQKGASVKAGFSIYLKSDYQGDLNGFPPRKPTPSQFVTIGTTLLIAGIVIAPNIKIEGGDGPDTIFATNTSILNAAYPWTAKTFPPQLGFFPKAPDTKDSLIIIQGDAGNDTITVVGVATALEIDVFGNDGTDSIALTPTNVLIGSDVIFGDNGFVERTSSGVFDEIASSVSGGGNNDKITVGPATNVIAFGGEGADSINIANNTNSIVFGDEGELDYSSGFANTPAVTSGIHTESQIQIPPGVLVSAQTIDAGVGGNDTITIATGTKLVFGGPGSDTITAGTGDATVFGDDGQVLYNDLTHAMISAISSNPADGAGDIITVGAGNNFVIGGVGNNTITGLLGNNVIIGGNGELDFTAGSLATAKTTFPANGGSNKITVGNGQNVIFGGNGANTIVAGNGSNVIVANDGEADYSAPGLLEFVFNTDVVFNDQTSTTVLPPIQYGGNNVITVGSGNDMILGGVHIDTITSGSGNSIIFGDNGILSFTGGLLLSADSINTAFGGNDVIRLGTGNNIAVGGMANDTIVATAGNQIILGDNAVIFWARPVENIVIKAPANVFAVAGALRTVETIDATDGGNDSITGGNGNDLIAGGILNDVITVGTGNSVILGDDGEFDFVAAGLISAETDDPGFGGNDTITMGSGKNIVYGGSGADTITATTGNQIIVGDNGTVTWTTPGVLKSVVADDIFNSAGGNQSAGTGPMPYGSNDIITGGAGNDLIAGGVGNDTITTSGSGNSVIMGDDGEFDFNAAGLLISATTQQLAFGGIDSITLGGGNNIALGGSGADKISSVSGNQIILGDNGTVTYATPTVLQTVVTTDVVFQLTSISVLGLPIFTFVTYGGNDTIVGGNGNDQIAGGVGSDLITTGNGSNDVLGDEGQYAYTTATRVVSMQTLNPTFGSADTFALGTGSNIAFGGAGADHISAGLGNQIILGDNGFAVFSPATGAVVMVQTSDPTTGDNDLIGIGGNGLIMGGIGNDTIVTVGTGNSVILGDNGQFLFNTAGLLMSATTADPTVGGIDAITLGAGNNIAFGGTGADAIVAAGGNQIVVGDDGSVTYSAPGVLQSVQAQDVGTPIPGAITPSYGGNDRIALGVGNNSVMGGLGADVITATDGNDLVLGDDGIMTWVNGVITSAATQNPSFGGNDTIVLGTGLNVIIGGLGNNVITGGNSTVAAGGNTVIGANGDVAFLPSGVVGYVENSDPTFFGSENISTGLGNDRILGGLGTNTIRDAGGSNVIFGADGALTFVDDTIEGDATLLAFSGQTKAGTGGWTIYSAGLLVSAISTDLTSGGNDTILAGGGQNLIVGGFGASKIFAGDGQNIIIGGNGQANAAGAGFLDQVETLAPTATTASNTITAGNGSNIIIGGLGADTITAGNGPDIVFGDAGEVTFSTFTRAKVAGQLFDTVADPVYAEAQSIAPSLGGADRITLGKGNIAVFGGNGNDTIKTTTVTTTGGSAYVVFGGDGQTLFSSGGWAKSAVIPFPQYTGTDTIFLGTNPGVILTGAADVLMSTLATPAPQMASGPAPTGQNTAPGLVASQIQPVVVEAEAIWAKLLGPNNARLAILNGITVQVGELPNAQIGDTLGDTIYIDSTADGWGWYIDPTASGNAGFQSTTTPGVMTALPGSAAAGHMDLLSTVLHEMGNVMGFPEDTGADVTGSVLSAGTRRLPALEGAVGVASGVPMIDWTAMNNAAAASAVTTDPGASTWIDNFVTNMGQAGGSKGPNAGIRIKPPGA